LVIKESYFIIFRKSAQKRDEALKAGQSGVPFDVKKFSGQMPQNGTVPEKNGMDGHLIYLMF
jgi:hypothetical protein